MARSANVLNEYLVKLGFTTDLVGYSQFNAALRDAASLVQSNSNSIANNLLKWQVAITGGFAAVGAAVLGSVDKVAMADQEYRLFALRMYTTTSVARELKISLDALGQPLENIAWDPELAGRFQQLVKDQRALTTELGPGFEKQMRGIRDIRFEVTRFGVELQYLEMMLVRDFAKLFGMDTDQLLDKLRGINDWVIANMPQIVNWLEARLVPVFQDLKVVLGETWDLMKLLGVTFTNVVGLLAGDKSLEGTTLNFEKMAKAIQDVMGWLTAFVSGIVHAEEIFLHVINAGALAMSGHGSAALGELKSARSLMSPESVGLIGAAGGFAVAGPPGAIAGALAGGIIGGGAEHGNRTLAEQKSIAQSAIGYAEYASRKLGIPRDVILEQWAFETGGFQSIAGKNNLAGIRLPGSTDYQQFGSMFDFANKYVEILSGHRYAGLARPGTTEEMARYLKAGSYMEADQGAYARGMARFAPHTNADQSISIGTIVIQVPKTNATADDIQRAVTKGVVDAHRQTIQRNLGELTEPGWSY